MTTEITRADHLERSAEDDAFIDQVIEESDRAWAKGEADALYRQFASNEPIWARRAEAAWREEVANSYRQQAESTPHPSLAVRLETMADKLEADAAYLLEEAVQMALQAGIPEGIPEGIREPAGVPTSEDGGAPIVDTLTYIKIMAGRPIEPDGPDRVISPAYTAGWTDAMAGRFDTARDRDWDYRRGHHEGVNKKFGELPSENTAGPYDDRAPSIARVGHFPTAVIWENETGIGWRVSYSKGPQDGVSSGDYLNVEEAVAAAEADGYPKYRQFVYPMIRRGPSPVADYTGEIRWDRDVSEHLVENYLEWEEISSSHLVSARSDDEAIAASLVECSNYLDKWTEEHGTEVEAPPVYAEIKALTPGRTEPRHIYARPAGPDTPATVGYCHPGPHLEGNGWHLAEVFTDEPDLDDLRWAADYWAAINRGKPPPIMIRSEEIMENRMRVLRRNEPEAALGL